MSKLVQFTDDVHFPDLNPNSYENLNNVKLDLINVSTRSINLSANWFTN